MPQRLPPPLPGSSATRALRLTREVVAASAAAPLKSFTHLMPTFVITRLTSSARWRRLLIAVVTAGATGIATAFVRPLATGPIHYESVFSTLVVLPLLCLLLTLSLRRVAWRAALGWLILELTAVCAAFIIGVWLGPGRMHHDLPEVMAVFWLVAVPVCAGLLVGYQWFRPLPTGPYCRDCGYCLIGTPSDCCPECGRPFDPQKLGVTREELRPQGLAARR